MGSHRAIAWRIAMNPLCGSFGTVSRSDQPPGDGSLTIGHRTVSAQLLRCVAKTMMIAAVDSAGDGALEEFDGFGVVVVNFVVQRSLLVRSHNFIGLQRLIVLINARFAFKHTIYTENLYCSAWGIRTSLALSEQDDTGMISLDGQYHCEEVPTNQSRNSVVLLEIDIFI